MWPLCYIPGINSILGHDAEDYCLKELQIAEHLMEVPDPTEATHRLRAVFPILTGRQRPNGEFLNPWDDLAAERDWRRYSDRESVKTRYAVQRFLQEMGIGFLASRSGLWGIRDTVKSLMKNQVRIDRDSPALRLCWCT